VQIAGVSFDTPKDNAAFCTKFGFPFPLLCDTTRALGVAYGACADAKAQNPKRITVVIGKDGKVAKVYGEVDARKHPEQVLQDARAGFA
jgi:peroxiredoxin Q/BCP